MATWREFHHEVTGKRKLRGGSATIAVIHGSGDTHLTDILRYYCTSVVGPHYLIDYDGTRHRFVDEDRIANHAGHGSGTDDHRAAYLAGLGTWTRVVKEGGTSAAPDPRYAFWAERWPGAQGPQDLLCALAPNVRSVGIELRSLEHRTPRGFFGAQYASLADLLREIGQRHGFPIDRAHVLGHEDCNPIARCTHRGPYDPGLSFDWLGLLSAASDRSPGSVGT